MTAIDVHRANRGRPYVAVALLFLLSGGAAAKVIVAEGTYSMGDADTKQNAKTVAYGQAKINALEAAGTYVQSVTRLTITEDDSATSDAYIRDIETVTAGVIEIPQDGITYRPSFDPTTGNVTWICQIEARIDESDLNERISRLLGRKRLIEGFRQARSELELSLQELDRLQEENRQLRVAADASKRRAAARDSIVQRIEAVDSFERGLRASEKEQPLVANRYFADAVDKNYENAREYMYVYGSRWSEKSEKLAFFGNEFKGQREAWLVGLVDMGLYGVGLGSMSGAWLGVIGEKPISKSIVQWIVGGGAFGVATAAIVGKGKAKLRSAEQADSVGHSSSRIYGVVLGQAQLPNNNGPASRVVPTGKSLSLPVVWLESDLALGLAFGLSAVGYETTLTTTSHDTTFTYKYNTSYPAAHLSYSTSVGRWLEIGVSGGIAAHVIRSSTDTMLPELNEEAPIESLVELLRDEELRLIRQHEQYYRSHRQRTATEIKVRFAPVLGLRCLVPLAESKIMLFGMIKKTHTVDPNPQGGMTDFGGSFYGLGLAARY